MRARCLNPKHSFYHLYGGRGIEICERWSSFMNFLSDMGERPKGKSLERLDNLKGYSPDNCAWRTPRQQARNRRDNRLITFNGVTRCITEWSERTGMSIIVIHYRIKHGWPLEKVFHTPVAKRS